jgi:hypothetical protein
MGYRSSAALAGQAMVSAMMMNAKVLNVFSLKGNLPLTKPPDL